MSRGNKKGQSTLEYAALIAVVVGAIIAINLYLKRGVEGHLRSASDDIGTQYDVKSGTYKYKSELKGEQEVTHSVTGKQAGDVKLDLGWTDAPEVGKGNEAQWTKVPGERETSETTTTGQ
jgi:hypothetical protein